MLRHTLQHVRHASTKPERTSWHHAAGEMRVGTGFPRGRARNKIFAEISSMVLTLGRQPDIGT